MPDKPYRLIPQPVPDANKRRGFYEQAIDDFISSGEDSSLIEFDNKTPETAYAGLMHVMRTTGRTDVVVRRRGTLIYLKRADSDS